VHAPSGHCSFRCHQAYHAAAASSSPPP
jgi:hypothetical protein